MTATDRARRRGLAIEAALAGGRVVREAQLQSVERKSGPGNYVTHVDRAAEEAVRSVLAGGGAEIPIVGEELGGHDADRYWLVDPIDGTVNFIHGFPIVAVSVALVEEGRPVVGCVHAPFLGTTFAAARGEGAEQDGRAIRVSTRGPGEAVVGTGFPFRSPDRRPRYLEVMERALERFEDLRRPGAVALDLSWVASGAFDGFFELGLSPWDVAAGTLLVEEAGGVVTDWSGGPDVLAGDILAGPPQIHAALLELTRSV